MNKLFIGLVLLSGLLLTGCPKDSRSGSTNTIPSAIAPVVISPLAPTKLAAIAHNGSIALSWSSSETKHQVHYATDSFAESAPTNYPLIVGYENFYVISGTSTVIKGLSNGTKYYFIVTSIKNGKESDVVQEVTATPVLPPAPPAPVLLTAISSNYKVTLDWSSDETEHRVHYATDSFDGENFVDYKGLTNYGSVTVGAATNAVIQGLSNDTKYFFVITSIKGVQESVASAEKSATPIPPPAAPTALTATPSNYKVMLDWSSDETEHRVHYATESFTGKTVAEYNDLTGYDSVVADIASTKKEINSLANGTPYFFVITSAKGVQKSIASEEATATPIPPPAAPTVLTATPSNYKVILDWLSDETEHRVHYATESFTGKTVSEYNGLTGYDSVVADIASTKKEINNLTNGTPYFFVVTSIKGVQKSIASEEATATPVPPPATPTNLAASPPSYYGTIQLDWSSDEAEHRVHYATETFTSKELQNYHVNTGYGVIDVTEGTSATISNLLTNGTTYHFVVTSIRGIQEGLASDEETAIPAVVPTGKINDTGIARAGLRPNGDCSTIDLNKEQDCSHGRDAQAAAGELQKIGTGLLGFDFTKIDSKGKILDIQDRKWSGLGSEEVSTQWSCVLDNVTGLVWELKSNDAGLHSNADSYNWYNTDPLTNGGDDGVENDDNAICFGYIENNRATYCNTEAYVARVNATNFCGADDWRMPSSEELRNIIYKGGYPSTNGDVFPFGYVDKYYFWSSGIETDHKYAQILYYNYGDNGVSPRHHNYAVRLVRGKAVVSPDNIDRYTDNLDGTVTDKLTGLMWKQCAEGQSGQNCGGGAAAEHTWQQALGVPATINAVSTDHTDWRLPNVNELGSLVDTTRENPAINAIVFPSAPSKMFWSSSRKNDYSSWVINFTFYGTTMDRARGESYSVRLVRDTE